MPQGPWETLGRIPPPGLIALGALVIATLVLQVLGLVDLVRTTRIPQQRKWIWCLIIVLGQLVGATVYWIVGRRTAFTVHIPLPQKETGERSKQAMDVLYGQRKKT